jgi:hypothetical protein
MPKKRIPDPETIVYCVECHKPVNGRGWYGPGCMGHEARPAPVMGPSVGTQR